MGDRLRDLGHYLDNKLLLGIESALENGHELLIKRFGDLGQTSAVLYASAASGHLSINNNNLKNNN